MYAQRGCFGSISLTFDHQMAVLMMKEHHTTCSGVAHSLQNLLVKTCISSGNWKLTRCILNTTPTSLNVFKIPLKKSQKISFAKSTGSLRPAPVADFRGYTYSQF
jgi:hypothetical protein